MFDEYPDLLTSSEVKEILDIGKNTLFELLNSGEIKSFRIGRVHKIPKPNLIEYIESKVSFD